jgi:hypothetical protein
MYQLASITLNRFGSADDILVFVADIAYCEPLAAGGSTVHFRDGRPPEKVTEAVSAIQTLIDTLWGEYLTALTGN